MRVVLMPATQDEGPLYEQGTVAGWSGLHHLMANLACPGVTNPNLLHLCATLTPITTSFFPSLNAR